MEPLPPPSNKTPVSDASESGPAAKYYDFDDVLVPGELKIDSDASFVQQSGNFHAGLLVFYGRVEVNSLIEFFDANMTKDNWQRSVLFKSFENLLLFEKKNRRCIICIRGKGFHPRVEIWVSPTGTTIE